MKMFYRVDNRLVHGQIIATWMPHLRPKTFVIVNDAAATSDFQQTMFRMVVPDDINVEFFCVREAPEHLATLRRSDESVLVLLETIQDAVRLFEYGHAYTQLNIGNVHHTAGRRSFTNAVFLGEDELTLLRKLFSKGVHVEIRTLPKEVPIDLRRAIEAA
ncbi:MAG: PTS sugar transporter subunit IIB [Myxococcota bacterium]|nr:PTS sugar transporter subunit IIB [Myxococcota bacterium]